jgi:hypothetical protein
MNALLTGDTNDQKCLSTNHGLQRLDIVTIWVFHPWHGWSHDGSALQYGGLCAESLYFSFFRSSQLPPLYLPAPTLVHRPSPGFISSMTSVPLDLFMGL